MRDELLDYYERELVFLRQMGAEFAARHSDVAERLQLGPDKSEDPHVERMIEAFAFLTGRIQLKLDDEYPQLTEALLNVLYPHYLAPIPAMTIAQFALPSERSNLTTGQTIARGTMLHARPVQGTRCRFRTCYPCVLWPIEVHAASLASSSPLDQRGRWAEAVIRITLHCAQKTPLAQLTLGESEAQPLESLRFFINGDAPLVFPLYEMIFNHATRVELRALTGAVEGGAQPAPINLPPSCLQPVGFGEDEGMLPYTARSFAGYRLLTEYFAFPDKFLFFDVTGLDAAARAGFGDQFELLIHLRDVTPPNAAVDAETFQLGCTPVVNLFARNTEPIRLSQEQTEYFVTPDLSRQTTTEVYAIDKVVVASGDGQQTREFRPFYGLRHTPGGEQQPAFWYANRYPSQRKDAPGTEVALTFVDRNFNPRGLANQTAIVHTICTNRDLPGKLPFGGTRKFVAVRDENELEIVGPMALWRARYLKKPTATLWPTLRRGVQWRMLSHLTLNYLSLVGQDEQNGDGSPAALQEMLRLYDFADTPATRKQIAGLTRIATRRVVRQVPGASIGTGFVRGLETTIEFDEREYPSGGVFLFAAVLEQFLALYASVNSFNQLVARTKQREGELKRWPPRTGAQTLL